MQDNFYKRHDFILKGQNQEDSELMDEILQTYPDEDNQSTDTQLSIE